MDDLLLRALGAQRDHPAEDLSVPIRRGPGWLAFTASVVLAALTGCGGDSPPAAAGLPAAGGGGRLTYAVPELPATLDPLGARGPSEELVIRQVYEPLTGELAGPYGATRRLPGLALSARSSEDRRVWTLELRPGVRFQDGSPFNASAVLANSRRWRSSGEGRRLLPDLFAVDAPRPDEVRFLFDSPAPDVPRLLASPRLGIVSPQALEPRSGEDARYLETSVGSGTGPFEPGTRGDRALQLVRSAGWWGSDEGLGPALDSVAFVSAGRGARLRLLRSGRVQVAGSLSPATLAAIAADPLLATVGRDAIGLQASVRGVSGAVQPLSGVWLTNVSG